ncbi:MAG: hypothetical protein NTU72_08145 [Fimbriimonadales bacterium]|nr:hypothetical protein [Fimbriimonadales bacterium]
MAQPVAATEAPKLILPGLSPSTVSAVMELESPPTDAAEANLAEDEADIVAAVNEVAAESDGMRGGGKTPAELLKERQERALLRHNSRQAAARVIAKEVNEGAKKIKPALDAADKTVINSRAKLFGLALVAALSSGPAIVSVYDLYGKNLIATSQQKIFTDVCARSADSSAEVLKKQTELQVLRASNLGLGPLMGTIKEQQDLDYKQLVATMNERMCTDKRASYAVAVAAVATASMNAVTAGTAWFLATAGATVAAALTAGVQAMGGDPSALRKLVNDAFTDAAQTVSGATVSGAPAAPPAQVPAAAVAEQPVALGEPPAALAASAPPRRSRGGRRTYRKAKRAGRTRKSRR